MINVSTNIVAAAFTKTKHHEGSIKKVEDDSAGEKKEQDKKMDYLIVPPTLESTAYHVEGKREVMGSNCSDDGLIQDEASFDEN